MRYRGLGNAPADPEYRRVGAFIDYWLAEGPEGKVTLEIVDEGGTVIRRFTSAPGDEGEDGRGDEGDEATPAAPPMAEPELPPGVGTRPLPVERGMHRFVWDLRHPGPWHPDERRAGRRGPMVAPGIYEVRLTVGDRTLTRTFDVRVDPRVLEDGVTRADLVAQERLNLRIRNELSAARLAAHRIEAVREELEARIEEADEGSAVVRQAGELLDGLEAIRAELVSEESIRYPPTMLIDQLEYLYGMTTGADQRPGADAYRRIDTLETELQRHRAELERMLEEELPDLNAALEGAGLTPVGAGND